MAVKVLLSCDPSLLTTVMIATECQLRSAVLYGHRAWLVVGKAPQSVDHALLP
jgi:hypothetical protein